MVTILTAYSRRTGVIGSKGTLPWPVLKRDFQFMKYLTTRKPSGIIMGRMTFESIGKPLPNRTSIILTSSCNNISNNQHIKEDHSNSSRCIRDDPIEGKNYKLYYRSTLSEAVTLCGSLGLEPVIFGGERVYREALLKYRCTLYITEIQEDYEGDTRFPLELLDRASLVNITEEVLGILNEKPSNQMKIRPDNISDNVLNGISDGILNDQLIDQSKDKSNDQLKIQPSDQLNVQSNTAVTDLSGTLNGKSADSSSVDYNTMRVCDNNVFYSFFKGFSVPCEK